MKWKEKKALRQERRNEKLKRVFNLPDTLSEKEIDALEQISDIISIVEKATEESSSVEDSKIEIPSEDLTNNVPSKKKTKKK